MITSQTVTAFLPRQIPDYVQEYYPIFVVFVTKYFEWLEQGGNPQAIIQNIRVNNDVDTTVSSLLTKFVEMYAPGMPIQPAADRSIIVKYFRDFYQKKGSEDTFKFFFRAFYNDDITIFYPNAILFKPSDNNWYTEQKLTVTKISGDPTSSVHTVITGATSKARAVINVSRKVNRGINTWELIVQPSSIAGTFVSGETLTATAWDWSDRTSSQVTMLLTRPLETATGKFQNTRSMLSSDQVIQDSYYFQQFSYVLRSRIGRDTWAGAVLKELHPAGLILFNDLLLDSTIAVNATSSFARTTRVETTVRYATRNEFYIAPGYSFDRLADFRTGTSATTQAGDISYDVNYNYPGEKVTFALQKDGDEAIYGTLRQIILPSGPSFDKVRPGVGNRQQIITTGNGVDFAVVNDRYRNTSAMTLTANAVIASFTTSITAVSSMVLMTTWVKDPTGNASNELANVLSVSVTAESPNTIPSLIAAGPINITDEVQRNYRSVALGSSQLYPKLTFYSSSNMIATSYSYTTSTATSTLTTNIYQFRPYNANRAQSYSRFSILFQGSSASTAETISVSIAVSSDSIFATTSSDLLSIVTVGR
jgi:hypothetical protein